MRLIRFFLVMLLAASFQWGWAQSQQEEGAPGQANIEFAKAISIYPNPAFDWVHVKVAKPSIDKVSVTLHNVLGGVMEVESERVEDDHDYIIRLRVKDLASGYYFLAVKDEDQKFRGTYKFVKR